MTPSKTERTSGSKQGEETGQPTSTLSILVNFVRSMSLVSLQIIVAYLVSFSRNLNLVLPNKASNLHHPSRSDPTNTPLLVVVMGT